MGAIVTVFKNTGGTEPARLMGELARWAEASDRVSASPSSSDVMDVSFTGSTDPGEARVMVEDVLRVANPSWPDYVGLEAVSTG